MRRYLLDTGSASDYAHRRRGVWERAVEQTGGGNRVGITVPVLGELFAGVEGSSTRERNLAALLRALKFWYVWPYDRPAAEEFGRIAAELRRTGRVIGQIDIQVAAVALSLSRCTVVSKDSDLGAVRGLDVEDWSS